MDVDDVEAEMDATGASDEFIVYPGALRGCTRIEADVNGAKYGRPPARDEDADREPKKTQRKAF